MNSKKIILLIVSLLNLKCEDKLDYKSKNQLTERTELNYTNPKIYLDENQVGGIMASKKIESNSEGSLSISFSYKNQLFKYYFKNNKSGLILD